MAFRAPTSDPVEGVTYDDIVVKEPVDGDMKGVCVSTDNELLSTDFVLREASPIL